jgi:aerobic C4-dicarboxylate transport protein
MVYISLAYMRKLFTNLTFWVLLSILAGILIGHFYPAIALKRVLNDPWKTSLLGQELVIGNTASEFLSGIFISTVKLFINPIIFLTIVTGIINMGNLKKAGRVGVKSLLYFEVVTSFALIIGIVVAMLIRPGEGVSTHSIKAGDVSKYINGGGFSWWSFLKHNSTLQVLIVALVLGIVLTHYKGRQKLSAVLQLVSKYFFKCLYLVMLFAPLGALGGMAFTVAKYGVATLLPLAKLMLTVYITMAVFIFGVLWLILRRYRIRLTKFLSYIKEELLIVLGTSSSEAALPSLMRKLEEFGCSRPVVGLVVPTGYSFNLDGTTIYLSMAVIFLAQVYHVHLSMGIVFSVIGILMVTSKGAAGVTGSGFIILASTLTAIRVIPVEGLALLLGVDRFMSEARAITNFIGNGVATIWNANNEKEFDRNKMEQALYAH